MEKPCLIARAVGDAPFILCIMDGEFREHVSLSPSFRMTEQCKKAPTLPNTARVALSLQLHSVTCKRIFKCQF